MSAAPRIVFMGTPQFAVSSLQACLALGEVVAVVTQPDKPSGRGQKTTESPVKVLAREKGLTVLQPQKLKGTDFVQQLQALKADVAVVTAYGKILPPDVLAAPVHGCLNVHASLLPRFRGAAPIQWAIASGDAVTGVCLMQMDAGMDTGPVLACSQLDILPTDTSASLHEKLSVLGGSLLRAQLPAFLAGTLKSVPQPTEGVVMAPMVKKEDGRLDFTKSAAELERRLRAFYPWPGATLSFEGAVLKVHAAQVAGGAGAAGTLLQAGKEGIEIACQSGSLLITSLQPEGKRVMTVGEFLASRKLVPGTHPFA